MTNLALAGVKVLDLTQGIAGPYATKILAGFGAEVIKIENPNKGDVARRMGPFLHDEPHSEKSGLFIYLNGNKKSVTLNLKTTTGVHIFNKMAAKSDIIIESFKPGTMERFSLGYDNLHKIKPSLVVTSISNFGQNGPYRNFKSGHLVAWGMSGGRYNDGEPGKRPVQGPGWITHYITGLFAIAGTATALYHARRTYDGQHVDISMMEAIMMVTTYPAVAQSYLGVPYNSISLAPELMKCKDGYVGINSWGIAQWKTMCVFLGMPELAEDPLLQNDKSIREHQDLIRAAFAEKIAKREKKELFESAGGWHVPISLPLTTKEILESPQHISRNYFDNIDHPLIGKVTMPGAPFKMTATPWRSEKAAPLLGQHNKEVYSQMLRYTVDDLKRLKEGGVI